MEEKVWVVRVGSVYEGTVLHSVWRDRFKAISAGRQELISDCGYVSEDNEILPVRGFAGIIGQGIGDCYYRVDEEKVR
jgi:hypothetical protein